MVGLVNAFLSKRRHNSLPRGCHRNHRFLHVLVQISNKKESISVGCVLTAAGASTLGEGEYILPPGYVPSSYAYPTPFGYTSLGIHYPPERTSYQGYPTLGKHLAPSIRYNLQNGPGTRHTLCPRKHLIPGTSYPSMNRLTDTCENFTPSHNYIGGG